MLLHTCRHKSNPSCYVEHIQMNAIPLPLQIDIVGVWGLIGTSWHPAIFCTFNMQGILERSPERQPYMKWKSWIVEICAQLRRFCIGKTYLSLAVFWFWASKGTESCAATSDTQIPQQWTVFLLSLVHVNWVFSTGIWRVLFFYIDHAAS